MTEELETYLYISPSEFAIYLLNTRELKNLYENKLNLKKEDNKINLIILNEFLENNIFKIEKLIGSFVKNLNLIIENDQVMKINLCVQKKKL